MTVIYNNSVKSFVFILLLVTLTCGNQIGGATVQQKTTVIGNHQNPTVYQKSSLTITTTNQESTLTTSVTF